MTNEFVKNGKPAELLVVDDDQQVRDMIVQLMTEDGFTVQAAENVKQGLALFSISPVVAVLSDIKMPDGTGIDLLKRVRSARPEVPVILLTGYAELALAAEAVRAGAFDFILKPFDPGFLSAVVRKAADYHRLLLLEREYKSELERTVKKRTADLDNAMDKLERASREMLDRLLVAAEYRMRRPSQLPWACQESSARL